MKKIFKIIGITTGAILGAILIIFVYLFIFFSIDFYIDKKIEKVREYATPTENILKDSLNISEFKAYFEEVLAKDTVNQIMIQRLDNGTMWAIYKQ